VQTVTRINALRDCIQQWRRQDGRIALVPTMGNLHAGHLQLVRHARAIADHVVVSLFVNPMQFDVQQDLADYPVTQEQDMAALMDADTDLLFMPGVDEVYPAGVDAATQVIVPGLSTLLEGACRPTHFDGVSTVVSKLFNMVQPDIAVFGEKDYQQLLLVRRMVADLNMPLAIEAVATVRDTDGLALSSRNGHLSREERALAPQLYQTLLDVAELLHQGERELAAIEQAAMAQLSEAGLEPQYVSIRNSADLTVPGAHDQELVVLAAARLGTTHLLDNVRVSIA